MTHLLSILVFVPIVGALISLLIPGTSRGAFRLVAVGVGAIQLVVLMLILSTYHAGPGFQLVERFEWFRFELGEHTAFRAEYYMGIDGLSMVLVTLSVFVLIIAVTSSWRVEANPKGYFVLLLILNGAIIGTFCALDLLLFYVFFEFMLLPMYFLIGMWGGPHREYASIKFFLYTLLGSILILIAFVVVYLSHSIEGIHTFAITEITNDSFIIPGSILDPGLNWFFGPFSARTWTFLLLLIGFGIKLPMVPLHTWLPDAHVEAPTAISVILAALLLKVGGYGIIRIAYPAFPTEAASAAWAVGLLGVVTLWYGAFNAMASKDLKRLIAYSSVSQMGFVLIGIATGTVEGVSGAIYQMFSHGIISAMLFVVAGVLYDRTHDRMIDHFSGLAAPMKSYTALVLISFFASMGLPGFSGFIAEVMIFLGAFHSPSSNGYVPTWMAVTSVFGLLLSAAYYLWTMQRMFFGAFATKPAGLSLPDLSTREYIMLLPLAIATIAFGVYPQPWLDIIQPFAAGFVERLILIKP